MRGIIIPKIIIKHLNIFQRGSKSLSSFRYRGFRPCFFLFSFMALMIALFCLIIVLSALEENTCLEIASFNISPIQPIKSPYHSHLSLLQRNSSPVWNTSFRDHYYRLVGVESVCFSYYHEDLVIFVDDPSHDGCLFNFLFHFLDSVW